MAKIFYTERDIDDLFNSGTRSLQVTDDVVLTELAYEKAKRLGLQLVTDRADTPPAAPVRPYIANGNPAAPAKPTVASVAPAIAQPHPAQSQPRVLPIEERIRSASIGEGSRTGAHGKRGREPDGRRQLLVADDARAVLRRHTRVVAVAPPGALEPARYPVCVPPPLY